MSDVRLEVYLFFKGNCREAMEFYKSVFGGELNLTTFSDVPNTNPEHKDWIMHANLEGGEIKLMASDSDQASPKATKIELNIGGTDEPKMRQIFEALAEGGQITMPLEKQFWGDIYGKLDDKFGIIWSMNIGLPTES